MTPLPADAAVFGSHLPQLLALVKKRLELQRGFHRRADLPALDPDLFDLARELGAGTLRTVFPYVGTSDFRTEDRLERIDTKVAQAVLEFEAPSEAPIGMQVVCEREPLSTR